MNVDEIEAFLCVAELGNFSKASLQLHRTQPAISRRISILEQSLKTVLFERTARSAKLTAAGRAFLPHAQAVRAALRDGARAVRDVEQRTQPPQPFSLAVVGTLANSHLVAALRKLEASLPGTSVALTTATSREVSELVKSGEAELGLRYFADTDPLLTCEPLSTERLYLVVSKGHPVPQRLPDLRTLAGEQWLGFPKDRNHPESYGHLLERELLACGIAAPRISSVDSLTAQKRLVQAGLGVTLMPLSSCQEELQVGSMRAVEVASLRAELPVVVVRRREGYTSRAAEGFLQILQQHPGQWRARHPQAHAERFENPHAIGSITANITTSRTSMVKVASYIPAMADAKVKAKTGKDWAAWFDTLDRANATQLDHKSIATLLHDKHGVPAWWSQTVTVEYKRARGLRGKNQKADGFTVSASKTLPASLTTVYAAASEAARRKAWFPRGTFEVSSQTENKYLNGAWNGTTRINIGFYSKGRNQAQIAIQVSKLSDESAVESERAQWKAALSVLEKLLSQSDAAPAARSKTGRAKQ